VLPKNLKKNIHGSYLNKTITDQQWCLSLLLLDLPKPCKRESQCAQLRNLCTSIYLLYCTTCVHFDYEYCNSPLHFLFPFKLLLQTKMDSRSHHKEVVSKDIYSPPSSSIGKKLMIELVELLLWMCFVANGVKCLSMIHHSSCTQRCWEKLVWFWFQQNCLWLFHPSYFELICICPTLLLEKHLKCCGWEFFFGYSSLIVRFCPQCGSLQG
jgi:hypothetical protein